MKDLKRVPDVLISEAADEKRKAVLEGKDGHLIRDLYNHYTVHHALMEIYGGKCGYCEIKPRGATPQVEHYRPKKWVSSLPKRNGYYWLSLEWSNLLLACPQCNNKKRNRFPLAADPLRHPPPDPGHWSATSEALLAEQPLLLHPEIDEPSDSITFEAAGNLRALDPRGMATIEVCQLNRGDLVKHRKRILDEFLETFRGKLALLITEMGIEEVFALVARKKGKPLKPQLKLLFLHDFKKLSSVGTSDREFSAYGRFLLENLQIVMKSRLNTFEWNTFTLAWQILVEETRR